MKLTGSFYALCVAVLFLSAVQISGADKKKEEKKSGIESALGGFSWRSIGPAVASGRIADFAVNPKNFSEYYVAVASGHLWKTTNSGTTFSPVFDNNGVYSLSCVVIDPNNQHTVWVGSGENNHQRALGYGNGVYKSIDGGKSWNNMGLKNSRQIGGIAIDPRNSNIVFVAAEGSVWGPGGERGLYKSVNGGKDWKKVIDISENTGVNNVVIDPKNPDYMYATSEQRRRHIFTKIGGGPESAVYRSTDGGETWEKSMSGLPSVDIGGMGIAVSPVNTDYVYLIMEAAEGKGGFFRSTNRGASWEKRSSHHEAGQYYNEIYCDPVDVNKVFSTETISQYTLDGGITWKPVGNPDRHVDDHALWINPTDTKNFIIGGDGGVYETFDGGQTFDFKENLPITQFYRVNVDNEYPFYNVYGGTQDNNSLGGPSRTKYGVGILNENWFVTNGGDGFWTAADPDDPNTVYAEAQYGNMVRYDRKTGEMLGIRPEPKAGELSYKWNWNTPLFISSHNGKRLYTAANMVFRSNDRGDSWETISPDLTAQIDRNTWPVMGKYWSIDAVAKDKSTSQFGTIVSLTESSVKENLLFAGTDDGVIQVTEDAKNWTKYTSFPGIPEYTYVSDILADKFNENVVYASFDNIQRDDFKPYLLKSTDKGKTWKSITEGLPENGTVHSIEQDNVNGKLLFCGTEFGFYVSVNGGESWMAFKNGLPDIPVRDIVIQKRENDLVIATFGRGFYVLDDYSPLRMLTEDFVKQSAAIFPVRTALQYAEAWKGTSQGSTYYKAKNPEFGANIYFYVKDEYKTAKQLRREREKELFKNGEKIPVPDAAAVLAEERETEPFFLFSITDETGNEIRKITSAAGKGIQKLNWDLRYAGFNPIKTETFNQLEKTQGGMPVLPGKYAVTLSLVYRDSVSVLSGPVTFSVEAVRNQAAPDNDRIELVAFQKKASELSRRVLGAHRLTKDLIAKVENLKAVIMNTPGASPALLLKAKSISVALDEVLLRFERRSTKPSAEENPPALPTLSDRVDVMLYTHWMSTSKLTKTEMNAYTALEGEFPPVMTKIQTIKSTEIPALEKQLDDLKAPWSPGR